MWSAFAKLFHEGGWVLYPIFAVSVLAWYVGLGKLLYFRQIRKARARFLEMAQSRKFDGLRGRAVGLDCYNTLLARLSSGLGVARVKNAFYEFEADLLPQLNGGISTMTACVVMAPLLGLLGTITGMNTMFGLIGQFGFGSPTILANGISMALEATLTGLGVAVATLLYQDSLLNQKQRLINALTNDRNSIIADVESALGEPPEREKGDGMSMAQRLIPEEYEKPEINLAPFVDTIMILLIFFVVTANLYIETGIQVSKPKSQAARTVGQTAILIGISREGTVHVYGRQVSIERLKMLVEQEVAKKPEVSVVIIADKDAAVGRAVEVMDQCALAGANKISIAGAKD